MRSPSKLSTTSCVSRVLTHEEGNEILYVLLPADAVPPAREEVILASRVSEWSVM